MRGTGAAGKCARVAVSLIAFAVLTSCADAAGPGRVAPDGTTPPGTYEAEAATVSRPARDVLQLTLKDVALGCTAEPRATIEVELSKDRDAVYLTVVHDVVEPAKGEACRKTGTQPLRVRLDGRGARASQVVVNNDAWGVKDQIGALQKCVAPFGCEGPPSDHCDQAWIELLLSGVEIAPERQTHTVACDGTWLILDVDAVISGCEGRDGASPPSGCEDMGTHSRWFARFDQTKPAGWRVVASGDEAGCTVPEAKRLDIPRSLCRGLPAHVR